MNGLLYEVAKVHTDDLLREGERQRLASSVERPTPAAPRASRRRVLWPFRRVARPAPRAVG